MAELTKLGRYQLRRVLGRGAMGVVYEGFDPTLNRRVAVKTILKNAAIAEETARSYSALFAREAQAAGRLSHPNIIQVHDFAEERDIAYLVMEFIQGRELSGYFDAGEKFDAAETVRIMGELLDALDFAHAAGVVHRDVKPANIMLDGQRRVKLADFGVARILENERSTAGTMVGTPAFMSPEQISGGRIDRRTDIFSAGVVLYQLLTGEQPFKGDGAWTVAKKIMENDPPPPSAVVTNVSPAYDAIVDKALAKNPAERFASAGDFAAALRATLGGGAPAVPLVAPKPRPRAKPDARADDAEIEFWRSIQNTTDLHEIEFYLEKFPDGTYAQLARHKIAKLRSPAEERKVADDDATVAIGATWPAVPPPPPAGRKAAYALPAVAAAIVIAVGTAAYLLLGRTPAPVPVAQISTPSKVETPAPAPPPKAELSAADIEKISKDTAERIHREYADKSAAEQAAATKAATEKAVQEKNLALKAAAEKAAAEKVVADKAAAEKAMATKTAAERSAGEYAAAEKAAAEKAAVEKAAAAKAAAASKPGWPSVGDRWVYEVRTGPPDKKYQATVEVLAVTASSVRDVFMPAGGTAVTLTHQVGARVTGLAEGVLSFAPYARALQELRIDERWPNVEIQRIGPCSHPEAACSAGAAVAGKERITVRAGTFDTWRIVVNIRGRNQSSQSNAGAANVEYVYWYAEEVKRIVKYQARGTLIWTDPNADMELLSYTPAGTK